MALIAAGIAVLAVLYAAMDGSEPPRARTRAEVPLLAAATHESQSAVDAGARLQETTAAPPTVNDLERELAASEPGARDLILDAALPAMVAKNPGEIARYAELQIDPHLRELMIRQVAQLWAKVDADQATAWARSLPDPSERDATLIDVSLSVALADPHRAVSLHEQQVDNINSDGVLEGLVQQWAQKEFDAALAWTQGRPAGPQRDALIQRLAFVQASRGQPEMAADLVRESIHSPEARTEALATVAQQSQPGNSETADSLHDSTDL